MNNREFVNIFFWLLTSKQNIDDRLQKIIQSVCDDYLYAICMDLKEIFVIDRLFECTFG